METFKIASHMFPVERSEIRRQYSAAWKKARSGVMPSAQEKSIAEVISEHPEYQALIESGEAALEAEFPPEAEQTNPYLHLGLHIAIREQAAIDRPPGVRAIHAALVAARGVHKAEHAMIECLAETLWEAQRANRPADDAAYLERLRRLAESRT
ncbi:MAG: DUF1841 family protein [Gammaproteobacteria bacterium]